MESRTSEGMLAAARCIGRHLLLSSIISPTHIADSNALSVAEKFDGVCLVVNTSEANPTLTESDYVFINKVVLDMVQESFDVHTQAISGKLPTAKVTELNARLRSTASKFAQLIRASAQLPLLVSTFHSLIKKSLNYFTQPSSWEDQADEDDGAYTFSFDADDMVAPMSSQDVESNTSTPSSSPVVFPISVLCSALISIFTSDAWIEHQQAWLSSQFTYIVTSLASMIPNTCMSGRLTMMRGVVDALFAVYGHEQKLDAAIQMWSNVRSLDNGPVHEVGKLMLVCNIAATIFSSECETKYEEEFWTIVMQGLKNTRSSTQRKKAVFVLKLWLANIHEGESLPSSSSTPSYPLMHSGTPLNEIDVRNTKIWWDMFILIIETIEEKQIHIITPVMQKLYLLTQRVADGVSPVPFQWLEVIFTFMFQHERVRVRLLGLTVFCSLSFSRGDRLPNQVFLFGDVLSCLGQLTLYKPSNSEEEDAKSPRPGALFKPFFLSYFNTVEKDGVEAVATAKQHFIKGIAHQVKNTAPILLLMEVMMEWPVHDNVFDKKTLSALLTSARTSKTAQEPGLRSATATATLRVIMHNIISAASGGIEYLKEIGAMFAIADYSDTFTFADEFWKLVSSWWITLASTVYSGNHQAMEAILTDFITPVPSPSSSSSTSAPSVPSKEHCFTVTIMLLLLVNNAEDAKYLCSLLSGHAANMATRTHMHRQTKARVLLLLSSVVEAIVVTRQGELRGDSNMSIIFQEQRPSQTALAASMEKIVQAMIRDIQSSIVSYITTMWSEPCVVVMFSVDCFMAEANVFLITSKFSSMREVAGFDELEKKAWTWMKNGSDMQRVLGACILSCTPTLHHMSSDVALLETVVSAVLDVKVPARALSDEENKQIHAIVKMQTKAKLPLPEIRQFFLFFSWAAVSHMIHTYIYSASHPHLSYFHPYILYSSTESIASRILPRSFVSKMLSYARLSIDGVYLEDAASIITVAALCVQHSGVTNTTDEDRQVVNQVRDLGRISLDFLVSESARHGVSLGFNVLHSVSSLFLNYAVMNLCIVDDTMTTFVIENAMRVHKLAKGECGIERRGILLPVAMWLTRYFSNQFTQKNVNENVVTLFASFLPLMIELTVYGSNPETGLHTALNMLRYTCAKGWCTVPLPPHLCSYLESRVMRTVMTTFFISLPPAIVPIILAQSLQAEQQTYDDMEASLNYHANTEYHKRRFRIMQLLVTLSNLCPFGDSVDSITSKVKEVVGKSGRDLLKELSDKCLERTNTERLLSIRYMCEWVLMISVARGIITFDSLTPTLNDDDVRPGYVCSVLTVGWRLVATAKIYDEAWVNLAEHLMEYALPTSLSLYTTCKLYGAATFFFLYEFLEKTLPTHEKIAPLLADKMRQRAMRMLSQHELKKHVDKLQADFLFSTFHPTMEWCSDFMYDSCPRMYQLRLDERVPPSLFNAIMTKSVTGLHQPQIDNGVAIGAIGGRSFLESERQCVKDAFVGTRSKTEVVKDRDEDNEDASNDVLKPLPPVGEGVDAVTIGGDVQKKIDTFALLASADAIGNENETFSARHTGRIRSDLIVVASLVALPTNLGGLCRTCEIFNVNTLTIPHERITHAKDFTALSVSSERWQNVEVVAPDAVIDYCKKKKAEGYAIVGIEQTAESKPLQHFVFEKKTVLVLGDEAKGIPADILNVMDMTVEIPQRGFIRSLNVHVSGSLVIYKYFEQQLHAEATQ
eukprot:m.129704 g.129704  ORF g.129704 m.129704 type:complete len:1719 (+) comp9463_c0_seq1:847-6003(+)